MIVGVTCFLFFICIALVSNIYGNHTATVWTTLGSLGFAVMGLWTAAAYVLCRHELTADGLSYRRITMQSGHLQWRDVRRVRYASMMGAFVLKSETNRTVRIPTQLMGIVAFARAVLDHVPSVAIDSEAHIALRATVEEAAEEEEDEADERNRQ